MYSELPRPGAPELPKPLQCGKVHEVNLSSLGSSFKVVKFARFGKAEVGALRTHLAPFRLFHSQAGGFVHASCDPDKDRRHPHGRAGGLPTHIP